MEEIAHECGLSRATLYLHFDSKETLFRALVDDLHGHALAAAEAASARGGAFEERVQRIFEAKSMRLFELLRSSEHAAEFVDENHRLCGDISARARQRYARILSSAIADAARAGEISLAPLELTADGAAELFLAASDGLKADTTSRSTPSHFKRRLGQLVRVLVAGLRAD